MTDVSDIESGSGFHYLDTGSPHYVAAREDVETLDIVKEGRAVRYNERFKVKGTNVNFVKIMNDQRILLRTYERGVEDETLACGTGSVAAALVSKLLNENMSDEITVQMRGGELVVSFEYAKTPRVHFTNIWLTGKVRKVFEGAVDLESMLNFLSSRQ